MPFLRGCGAHTSYEEMNGDDRVKERGSSSSQKGKWKEELICLCLTSCVIDFSSEAQPAQKSARLERASFLPFSSRYPISLLYLSPIVV